MRFIWVFFNLILSSGILSVPIIIFGWFDRNKWLVGKISRFWARWVIWSMGITYEIRGLQHLNYDQQYIFMSNHESALDVLLGVACLPYNIIFLAKKELFRIPIFGWAMQASGMIKIDRQNREKAKQSVDEAVEKLTGSTFSTLLYPEGTRSETGEIQPFKKGGFILAIRSKLPVVPITILGTRSVLPKKSLTLHKGDIKVIIGFPIDTADLYEEDKNKLLIQCRNAMIKEKEAFAYKYIPPESHINNNKSVHSLFFTFFISLILISFSAATDTVKVDSHLLPSADIPDTEEIRIISSLESLIESAPEEDIFEAQMTEAKYIYAEAIISDLTGDTLDAAYQFELLFEALANIEVLSKDDEFQTLEFNRILTAAIDYYEDEAVTIDKVETGLSVAVLRDKLNKYVYSQKLEELEYVEERVEIIQGHIPITYNQKVSSIIRFFQNEGRSSFQKWLNRISTYKPIILPILEEESVPTELFYLAMIESGLNPKAYSYAHASGIWQFIASTGKMYGLKKNWWIDERRDFEKATRAAANYLKDLYAEFGDWYLAFAAYNCGSTRVKKEMKRHQSDDYWLLKRLPSQTRNYVPNIMAAIFISNDPQKYGFAVVEEEGMNWRTVNIDKSVSLEILSECAKLDIGKLQIYNPELKQGTLPPLKENETYPFRLPLQASPKFDSLLAEVQVEHIEEVVFLDHKVQRGESLWLIGKKYNVRIQDIVSINKLARAKYIRPGQILQIPTDGYDIYRKAAMTQSSGSRQIYYTVRYGDTLGQIAIKYHTSVRKIKKWNGLRSDRIYSGQKLKIWTKA